MEGFLLLVVVVGLALAVYIGISNKSLNHGPIELNPATSANESSTDTTIQTESMPNNDDGQSLSRTENKTEEQSLVSVQYLTEERKLDLSPFNEEELLVLRKYMTHCLISFIKR